MAKPADIGCKRLISLAPEGWARWVTNRERCYRLSQNPTMSQYYDVFISYGRADSKAFATKLYDDLTKADFNS